MDNRSSFDKLRTNGYNNRGFLMEDRAPAHSKKFQKSVKDSYREYKRKGGGVSLETLIAQNERELARLARKKRAVHPSTGSG